MNEETISFYSRKPEIQRASIIVPNTFTFKPIKNKQLNWIINALKKWLVKKGVMCRYHDTTEEFLGFKQVSVNVDNILQVIMNDSRAMMSIYNENARFVVVGIKGMKMLEKSIVVKMYGFNTPPECGNIKYINGLEVLLVPHFEGVLVLPDFESSGYAKSGNTNSCHYLHDWDR